MSSGPIDLATLGIEVETNALDAISQLNALGVASEGAEAAVEGLEDAAQRSAARLRANAEAAANLRSRMQELQGSAKEVTDSVFAQSRAVESVAAGYANLITRIGLTGRELEQFNALQRAGADAADLQGLQLAQLAGQYHDLADAAKAAGQAEQARAQQAGSQFGQRLNENFGITRPVGDDKQRYPSSARDSARVFQEAADEAEAAAKQAAAYADQADRLRARISPLVGVQQTYNRELAEAQKLMEAGALSATEYAQAVALAGQNRSAGVSSLLKTAVGGESDPTAQQTAAQGARLAAEADDLRAKLDPLYSIQRDYNRELERVDKLFAAGALKANVYAQAVAAADKAQEDAIKRQNAPGLAAVERLQKRAEDFEDQVDPRAKSQRQYDRVKAEGDDLLSRKMIEPEVYAKRLQQAKEAQDAFNGGLDVMGKKAGLSGQQMFWLLANVKDFANQVFAGGSVITAGMQQGPMLAQIIGMAEGGFGAGLKSIGDMLKTITLSAWGAAAGITAAVAAVALLEYRGDAIRSGNSRATYGVGRRAGMTGDEIGQAANENTDYLTAFGGSAARDAAQELAKSGNIARDSFKAVLGAVKDYAYTTDQEAGPAAKELAGALDGSSGGVDRLNAKLGFLNSSTRETYLQMVASGDKTNAQKLLIDALVPSLERANERLNIFQKTWNLVKNTVSGAVDAAATGLDNIVTGGSLENRLKTAETTLAQAQQRQAQQRTPSFFESLANSMGAADGGLAPNAVELDTTEAQKNVDDLRKKIADFAKSVEIARAASRSLDADNIVKGLSPLDEQIKKVTANSSMLQQALSSLSIPTDKIKETEAAVAALARQTQQLAVDARSGGAAFADMVKGAQEGVRTVGFTDTARQVASNNFTAEQRITDLARNPQNITISDPVAVEAQKQKILNDPSLTNSERNLDIQNLQVQVDGYAAQVKAIRETAALGNQQAQQQAFNQSATQGGAFNRAPQSVQGYIQKVTGSGQFGTVGQDLAAALIDHESSNRENARPLRKDGSRISSAYGLTQLLKGTAKEMGVDAYDPEDNVRGGIKYLDIQMRRFGDKFTALAAYFRGPETIARAVARPGGTANIDPEARKYALDIIRREGLQGGQSAKEYAERTDAVAMQTRETREMTKAERDYRNDPQGLAVEQARIKAYYEEIKRSGSQATVSAEEMARLNSELVRTQLTASGVKVTNDLQFEREQLGRTSGGQKIASTLRSNQIGADTATGQAVTAQIQYNEALSTAKGLATDAWGSISQGIMSGASATDIALSALGRFEQKLLQMAGDELIAKLFKGLTGDGKSSDSGGLGGLGGFFGKLFGMGGGGVGAGGVAAGAGGIDVGLTSWMPSFADGGVMTSKGKAPLRAYSSGGVATTPQTALFGEGSKPEAFVPLPDGRSIPVTMDRADSPAVSAPVSLSATVYMNGSSGDPATDSQHSDESARKMRETMQNMHDEMIAKDTRPGGALYRSGARRSA